MILVLFSLAIQHAAAIEVPDMPRPPVRESGIGTVYGYGGYHGNTTANGETFRPRDAATCAHRELPFDTWVLLEDPDTGQTTWCRVNDRGPYVVEEPDGDRRATTPQDPPTGRESWSGIVDLSIRSAKRLGVAEEGLFKIRLRYWRER